MLTYFEIFTDEDLAAMSTLIETEPRNAKVKLATDIVTWLHSSHDAKNALKDFESKFVRKETPDEVKAYAVGDMEIGILDLMTKICGFTTSNGEARRIIQGGGVHYDDEKITDPTITIYVDDEPKLLKVGKRKFGWITS